ncbi:AraC family transcriptional regulator [uncultured Neptuniibacter sp.]|uniref:AraC family transcriptional regulator n=1 Tax=uncultured Neptuniibacter sp. TaxID=502143 RepID=UPI002606AAB3|nr:AraC family transcriptional regulator [uncultured Neptuniibacter sp.]
MKNEQEIARYRTVDELGGLETLSASYHRQNFSRHTHEGYTVGIIEQGAQRFLRNGSNHVAPQDSIILVNHDEVHDGHSASEGGWTYQAIYPLPEQLQQVRHEAGLSDTGSIYFSDPVIHDPELAQLLRLTFDQLHQSDNRLLRETLLYSALLKLMQRHGREHREIREPINSKSNLALVHSFLREHPAADISLDDLAVLSGLSTYHLIKQFKRIYGLPPHAFQIQARIRLAKNLLQQGCSLLEAALNAGFHDQSHFNRHFKRALGITPGQFLQQLRK